MPAIRGSMPWALHRAHSTILQIFNKQFHGVGFPARSGLLVAVRGLWTISVESPEDRLSFFLLLLHPRMKRLCAGPGVGPQDIPQIKLRKRIPKWMPWTWDNSEPKVMSCASLKCLAGTWLPVTRGSRQRCYITGSCNIVGPHTWLMLLTWSPCYLIIELKTPFSGGDSIYSIPGRFQWTKPAALSSFQFFNFVFHNKS